MDPQALPRLAALWPGDTAAIAAPSLGAFYSFLASFPQSGKFKSA